MKNKLFRFKVVSERDNVIQPGKELFQSIKGNWGSSYFKNDRPITVELACGRGEYSVALAGLFPDRNYIGVDIKGDRIWKGSTLAIEQQLVNIGFLRTNILNIESFFDAGEVDEIWITFPDPRPKKRDVKRRLTNSRFLDLYKKILRPGGYVRFKTDNTDLFRFSLEELQTRHDIEDLAFTDDVYQSPLRPECFDIKTRYEEMFASQGEK
ncbi:MAG TPA: tRNA (guanosine(46)-N7)-methyltransferase TrmB, partial [Cyclobacteriaceae bacterium]|nr:tRNA (guanosine(46)-N7)-methyltransferase TrmB [Cyclobacteriaceae bacterium]